MKVRRGFIRKWAYYETKGNDSVVNSIIKRLKREGEKVSQEQIEALRNLMVAFKVRPLFYPEIEREIERFYQKIRKAKTNKKHYNRKRNHEHLKV